MRARNETVGSGLSTIARSGTVLKVGEKLGREPKRLAEGLRHCRTRGPFFVDNLVDNLRLQPSTNIRYTLIPPSLISFHPEDEARMRRLG